MALNPQSTTKETIKAAVTVLVGLFVLAVFIIFLGGHRFWEEFDHYTIRFESVQDLTTGRPVKFAGLAIGRVETIDISKQDPSKVDVTIGINQGFDIYSNTKASISQKGLVGDNYVLLELDPPIGQPLKPGSNIEAKDTVTVSEIMAKVGTLVDTVTPKLESIATNIQALVSDENAANIAETLRQIPGFIKDAKTTLASLDTNIGDMKNDFHHVAGKVGSGIDKATANIDNLTTSINATLAHADIMLSSVQGSLTTSLTTITKEMSETLNSVEAFSDQLQTDLGYDQDRFAQVLENVNRLSRDLRMLSQSLRERPWQIIYKPEGRAIP
ncbi:MAG: MlaD family protein [Desulfovibrio sp.]|uniref:MlaD family protein n=1 Tax=Desulfovibrio sp. 7SRBS1 TaxID=3378064 RepID=UPI003B3F4BA5